MAYQVASNQVVQPKNEIAVAIFQFLSHLNKSRTSHKLSWDRFYLFLV